MKACSRHFVVWPRLIFSPVVCQKKICLVSRTFGMSENPLQIVALARNPPRVHQIPIFLRFSVPAPRRGKKKAETNKKLININFSSSVIDWILGRTSTHVLPCRYQVILHAAGARMTEPPDSLDFFVEASMYSEKHPFRICYNLISMMNYFLIFERFCDFMRIMGRLGSSH